MTAPAGVKEAAHPATHLADGEAATSQALGLPGAGQPRMEEHPAWPMVGRLPVGLSVAIPVRGFKVSALLALRPGHTIESRWLVTQDVPLQVGELHICWGEFEVVEQRMALRLTRLI